MSTTTAHLIAGLHAQTTADEIAHLREQISREVEW